jgi:folate-binding protein YgfZ
MTVQDTTRAAYDSAHAGAVWTDRSHEGRVEVGGADRLSWLQGLLSNDVASLASGQGCYATYLTPQGRMIADVRVLVREDVVWLDLPGPVKDTLLARLGMFVISEDVELRDLAPAVSRIAVHGPAAAPAIAAALVRDQRHRGACAEALASLPAYAHLAQPWQGHDVLVAADRRLVMAGFDLYVTQPQQEALVQALQGAGVRPNDDATWHLLHVEAGQPRFGIDMDEDTIPLEADLESDAISFTKGCYVGQEIIVRMRDRGQGRVAKRLMRLVAAVTDPGPSPVFAAGAALVAADGREVGRVTSAAWSPRAGATIGLGYVQRAHAEPGATLAARAGEALVEVRLEPRVVDRPQ